MGANQHSDLDHEHDFRSSWGLLPGQWRPVRSMSLVSQRAALVYRTDTHVAGPVLLRARRAYDLIASSETPLEVRPTGRGLELTVPLGLIGRHLRLLDANRCMPDAVILPEADSPATRRLIDELRQMIRARPEPIDLISAGRVRS
jgi:hypothetical protein